MGIIGKWLGLASYIVMFSLCVSSANAQLQPESIPSSTNQPAQPRTSITVKKPRVVVNTPRSLPATAESTEEESSEIKRRLTSFEFLLSTSVLTFGLVLFIIEFVYIRSKDGDIEQATLFFLVTLIVIGTLFLITAGYTSKQVAPAMGLFGTIAGYLLGKRSTSEDK